MTVYDLGYVRLADPEMFGQRCLCAELGADGFAERAGPDFDSVGHDGLRSRAARACHPSHAAHAVWNLYLPLCSLFRLK